MVLVRRNEGEGECNKKEPVALANPTNNALHIVGMETTGRCSKWAMMRKRQYPLGYGHSGCGGKPQTRTKLSEVAIKSVARDGLREKRWVLRGMMDNIR